MEVEEDERPPVESVEDFIRPYVKKIRSEPKAATTLLIPDINVGDVDGASTTLAGDNDTREEDEEKDPYEVTLTEFRRVSHEEFAHSLVEPVDYNSVRFHFNDMVQLARQQGLREQQQDQYDPITLVKAVAVACNLKGWARLVASCVPHSELQMLEDFDTTRLLQYIKSKPEAKQKMDQMMGEFLYACMTVDMVTERDKLPQNIARALSSAIW